jgi:hypothetical protein
MRPLIVICFATACSVSSPYMRPTGTAAHALHAPADQALVVFVRPSQMAWAVGANILDEQGRFLGDSLAGSYFAVAMPPGAHMFTVWAENTDGLSAELAPGRVYYVEVAPTMGAFSAQMHLFAIKPGRPSWDHLSEWMARAQEYTSDFVAGQSNLDKRHDDVAERLRRAREHLARYSGDDRARHSLAAGDGV